MATTTKDKTPAPVCRCGCKAEVGAGSSFRPGHDARFVSQLVKSYEAGTTTRDKALAEATAVSAKLGAKAARSLEQAADRVAARKTTKDAK